MKEYVYVVLRATPKGIVVSGVCRDKESATNAVNVIARYDFGTTKEEKKPEFNTPTKYGWEYLVWWESNFIYN